MPTTPVHSLPYPADSDPADVPGDLAALAEAVDSKLDAITPGQITGATSGQLLIANSSGVVTARTVTGDVTVSNTGVTDIAASAVGTPELANSAVTTAKIDNGAVTAAKLTATYYRQEINAQTSDYTLVASDTRKLVTVTSATDRNVTVDTSLALTAGERVDVARLGTGNVTFVAGSGTTVNGTPGLRLRDRYSAATVVCLSTNNYLIVGDLVAVS